DFNSDFNRLMRRQQPRRWRGSGCCHGEGGSVVLAVAGGGVNGGLPAIDGDKRKRGGVVMMGRWQRLLPW
nr:hypothetical protein [Tanacetum cinerariifolium]